MCIYIYIYIYMYLGGTPCTNVREVFGHLAAAMSPNRGQTKSANLHPRAKMHEDAGGSNVPRTHRRVGANGKIPWGSIAPEQIGYHSSGIGSLMTTLSQHSVFWEGARNRAW